MTIPRHTKLWLGGKMLENVVTYCKLVGNGKEQRAGNQQVTSRKMQICIILVISGMYFQYVLKDGAKLRNKIETSKSFLRK